VIVGTNNTTGMTLAVPPYLTTYVAQTTQTQPAGIIAGVNFTTTTIAGSTAAGTLNSSGLTLALPAWVTAGGGAQLSLGVSTGGNTAGNTGIYSGQVVFAGGNNITLSVSSAAGGAQSITISGPTQTAQTIGLYALGNTTSSLSSGTFDARSMSFNATGPISVGYSAGSIVLSAATVAGQTSGGMYVTGNTTNNSSTTLPMSSWLWNAQGAQTIGFSNGSIQLSVPATSSLVGTNGISVSTNGSTISVSAINESIYITGNTTGQSSSSYYVPGALTISAGAGISIGWSNGSLIISA
jgi:hypothetical protein